MTDSIKPLVDRIVSHPVEFKRASKKDSFEAGKSTSYIMIGSVSQTKSQNGDAKVGDEVNDERKNNLESRGKSKAPTKMKNPSSFAEALRLYTTKKGTVKGAREPADEAKGNDKKGRSLQENGGKASSSFGTDELLLSDEEYRGSSTDEESENGVALENEVADEKDLDHSPAVSSVGASTSSSEEEEDEVFHEAKEFVRPDDEGDEDDEDDESFHDSASMRGMDEAEGSDSGTELSSAEDDQISETEKLSLLKEAQENHVDQWANVLKDKNQHEDSAIQDGLAGYEEDHDQDELKHKKPLAHRNDIDYCSSPTPPAVLEDMSQFYKFDESINDHGYNDPQRIVKNWGPKLSQLRPRGLLNHGVTCYTNAAVQSMLHIPAIQHYLFSVLRGQYEDVIKPNSVTKILADTSLKMWSPESTKNSYINPDKLINVLDEINCMMSAWNQEDSHEYFMSLMSRLQEDSVPKGRKMTESILYDIFGGSLRQSVKCSNCGQISTTEQPIYDLTLHLKGKKSPDQNNNNSDDSSEAQAPKRRFSIEKSIRDFFTPELIKRVDNKEGYTCEKCKKVTNAVKSNKILRAPETLVVHLKKFRFNGTSLSKMKQAVSYPMFLDLTEYCDPSMNSIPARYQLISVVVHEGRSLSSGHYIAHCKQPDGSWATYDDEYINKISEKQLLKEPNAYYLVFTRLTPKSLELNKSTPPDDFGLPQIKTQPSHNPKRKNKKNKKRKLSR